MCATVFDKRIKDVVLLHPGKDSLLVVRVRNTLPRDLQQLVELFERAREEYELECPVIIVPENVEVAALDWQKMWELGWVRRERAKGE